jgi:hypothetical protein
MLGNISQVFNHQNSITPGHTVSIQPASYLRATFSSIYEHKEKEKME